MVKCKDFRRNLYNIKAIFSEVFKCRIKIRITKTVHRKLQIECTSITMTNSLNYFSPNLEHLILLLLFTNILITVTT